MTKINAAYEAGWIEAACWAKRDDLIADIESPAYIADREAHLDSIRSTPAPDCRTCEYGSKGDGIWQCDKCVLGDMYKERAKVVLWRTE